MVTSFVSKTILAADDYKPVEPAYSDYEGMKLGFAFPDRQSMNIQKVFRDNAVNRAVELGWTPVETDAKWDPKQQSANISELGGGQKYLAIYEMIDTDPEGEVIFEILVTDSVGLTSDPVTETTNSSQVIFDRTLPTLDIVNIQSTNENNSSIAITGDDVVITFTPAEPLLIDSINATIANETATVTQDGDNYIATLTISGDEPGGILPYTIDFKDRASNPGIQVTSSTDDSYVNHDIVPPELLDISIFSNNLDTTWAKPGDTVFVKFVANEELDNLDITISGVSSEYLDDGAATYRGYHIMDDNDNEGIITFNISYTDLGGATGPDGNATTDETSVRYDRTLPILNNILGRLSSIMGNRNRMDSDIANTE